LGGNVPRERADGLALTDARISLMKEPIERDLAKNRKLKWGKEPVA